MHCKRRKRAQGRKRSFGAADSPYDFDSVAVPQDCETGQRICANQGIERSSATMYVEVHSKDAGVMSRWHVLSCLRHTCIELAGPAFQRATQQAFPSLLSLSPSLGLYRSGLFLLTQLPIFETVFLTQTHLIFNCNAPPLANPSRERHHGRLREEEERRACTTV